MGLQGLWAAALVTQRRGKNLSSVSEELVDQAGTIREGEELNLDILRAYLEPILGAKAAQLEVKQFPGGFSNLTYLLSSGNERWVLRRPPFGSKVKSATTCRGNSKSCLRCRKYFPTVPHQYTFATIKTCSAATSI